MAQERKVELIRRAIELSKMSVKNGNHPFGALLALDGFFFGFFLQVRV